MAIGGSILIDIGANVARLKQDMGKVVKEVETTKAKIERAFSTLGSLTVAGVGMHQLTQFMGDAVNQALEAEKAFNQLRTQIENLGVSYDDVREKVEASMKATSEYAIVQEEDVARALQQLVLYTGDLAKSQEQLNLVYDLAYQKSISVEEAAQMVGRAMTGNVERLGRYFSELAGVNEKLGENATDSEKAAYAMQVLQEKVSGASEKMTRHEQVVKRIKQAYANFLESFGGNWLEGMDIILNKLGIYEKLGIKTTQTNRKIADSTAQAAEAAKKSAEELAKETKARSDARKATEEQAKALEKLFMEYQELSKNLENEIMFSGMSDADKAMTQLILRFDELKTKFKDVASGDLFERWFDTKKAELELKQIVEQAEKARDTFMSMATSAKDSLEFQIETLEVWRTQAVKSYDDALAAAKGYYNQARSLEESLRQGLAFREKMKQGKQTPIQQMEAEAAAIKKLFSTAVTPEQYEQVRIESEKYLQTWEKYKNEFGGWSIFTGIDQIHEQTLGKIEALMTSYDEAANHALAFADSQAQAIADVDARLMELQNQVVYLDQLIAAQKVFTIDTSNAQSQLAALLNQIMLINSMINSTASGASATGGGLIGGADYSNYGNTNSSYDSFSAIGDAIVGAIEKKVFKGGGAGNVTNNNNIGITMQGGDSRRVAEEMKRLVKYGRI